MTTAATQKIQLLADALAMEFSQSLASAQCPDALQRLLPSLEYLAIAVSNPAQAGSIVTSANCAAEGPTTLHIHDTLSSAVGLAISRGQPLQTSLLGESAAKVVPAWTDVQQMVAAAPTSTHLLCVPFGCYNNGGTGSSGNAADSGEPACGLHAPVGSGTGALLFGLSSPPDLDARRKAMLVVLAQCLPAPMARLSADTLAFVNFACGNHAQCTCCCDSEGEEESWEPGSPCGSDGRPEGGDGGEPSQALLVPHDDSLHKAGSTADQDAAGPSSHSWDDPAQSKQSGRSLLAAAAAAAAAAAEGRLETVSPPPKFSKALVAAAGERPDVGQQNPLTLTFRLPMMEREYGQWIARFHLKVDMLFSLLLALSLLIISFQPLRLPDLPPSSALLGLGMLLPVAVGWFGGSMYATWRDVLIAVMRLYVVAFINLVSLRNFQAHLSPERVQQWVTFWLLTGAESLCTTALGFPIRMQLHLPLQFAALGLAAWNLPHMCSECYPNTDPGACFQSSAAMAALYGFLLPTLGLRYMEQRSRATFAHRLRAAAAGRVA